MNALQNDYSENNINCSEFLKITSTSSLRKKEQFGYNITIRQEENVNKDTKNRKNLKSNML
jgi:hypothetical protein